MTRGWILRMAPLVSALAMSGAPTAAPGASSAGKITAWSADSLPWHEDRPGGTKRTILEGDPSGRSGVVTYAFRIPDGAWFPPHTHPATARVFVLKGTLLLGDGDTEDRTHVRRVASGSVVLVPGGLPHYEGAEGETIIIGVTVAPFRTDFRSAH